MWRYYYLKDHLGSVKMTVGASGNTIGYDHYYRFGMTMQSRSYISGIMDGRYQFAAKERDGAEIGYDYFGARYYDSWSAGWLSVDPLAEKYPSLSPYNYVANNPLRLMDVNGDGIWDYVKGAGQAVGGFGVGFAQGAWGMVKSPLTMARLAASYSQNPASTSYMVAEGVANNVRADINTIAHGSNYEMGKVIGNWDFAVASAVALAGATRIAELSSASSVRGLTVGEVQRLNVANEVKLGVTSTQDASKSVLFGGAGVEGRPILGSGKLVQILDAGNGEYKVVVSTMKDGKVVGTSVTTGKPSDLGLKNVEELMKHQNQGWNKHILQDKE